MASPVRSPSSSAPGARFRLLGIGLAVLAAVFASSAGLLLRFAEGADPWVLLVFRSLGYVTAVGLFILLRQGRRFFTAFGHIGGAGLVVAVSLGLAFIAFVLALMQANVATVVAVLSLSPLLAGLIGWAFLGERPSLLSWGAMTITIIGVSLVVLADLGAEAAPGRRPVQGLLLAVLACAGYTIAVVGLRSGRARDMSPAVCLSGVVAGIISLSFVLFWGTGGIDALASASAHEVLIGILLGTVQLGAQYILLTIATRYASAADVALAMILEVVLAPLWVWLFVGEAMTALALGGGGLIVAALIVNGLAPPPKTSREAPLQS